MRNFNYQRLNVQTRIRRWEIRDRAARETFKWMPIPFGKYFGNTLPEIILLDAPYFYWMVGEIGLYGDLERQAMSVACRAAHILPPGGREDLEFGIEIDRQHRLQGIHILQKCKRVRWREPFITRHAHLDLAIVRQFAGQQNLAKDVRRWLRRTYFGNGDVALTQRDCEQFFENDDNFDILCRLRHDGIA